jgi:hypothetical protein
MTRWLRWTLTALASIATVFAGIMARVWGDDIFGSFPFWWGLGPISLRAVAFWLVVAVPFVAAVWGLRATHREKQETQRRQRDEEEGHARAVALRVSHESDKLRLVSENQGTHLVRDIQIVADRGDAWRAPDREPLPELAPSGAPGVALTYPIAGGWFIAGVEQLSPGRGLAIASARLRENDFTQIRFLVSWHDHEGRLRKRMGVADLKSSVGEISLAPRPAAGVSQKAR